MGRVWIIGHSLKVVIVSYMLSNLVGFFCELRNLALQLFFFSCRKLKVSFSVVGIWILMPVYCFVLLRK